MPGALFHAPTVCSLMGSSLSLSKPRSTLSSPPMASSSARIAVVGDVHNDWCLEEETKALRLLQPDLVLFTGDFGEENVALVQSLANLEFPKAVILGNHDAWYTQQFSGKKKDGVQRQLESLGDAHVAYQCVDIPLVKLSVVGGRPFSCGGEKLFRKKLLSARVSFLENLFGVICSSHRQHRRIAQVPFFKPPKSGVQIPCVWSTCAVVSLYPLPHVLARGPFSGGRFHSGCSSLSS